MTTDKTISQDAARKLLEACEALLDEIGECDGCDDRETGMELCPRCGWNHEVLAKARAAIAKATS